MLGSRKTGNPLKSPSIGWHEKLSDGADPVFRTKLSSLTNESPKYILDSVKNRGCQRRVYPQF
jgi:hypothetical protein